MDIPHTASVAVKVFEALSAEHINIRYTDHVPSGISLQIGVSENDYRKAIHAIYRTFTNLPA